MSKYAVKSVQPEYGVNYREGYYGFTFTDSSFISQGIAWFTRWNRMSDVKVSHVFLVSGENEIIEATWPKVRKAKLTDLLANPKTHVVFRKPRNWSGLRARKAIEEAEKYVGQKYDSSLILSQAISNSVIGKLINTLTGGFLEKATGKMLNNRNMKICSELAARTLLVGWPELKKAVGCVLSRQSPENIDPQELFEDPQIYKPWVTDKS